MEIELDSHLAGGGTVQRTSDGWRLEIPAGQPRHFRLAQLDDYTRLSRRHLIHSAPVIMSLRARLSGVDQPGTWGFGFWNDPFGLSIGFGGAPARLPALPQTAWFMHASPPNWLSFQENTAGTPSNGFFAGIFHSLRIPSILFLPGLLVLPLLASKPVSRLLRRLAVGSSNSRLYHLILMKRPGMLIQLNGCAIFAFFTWMAMKSLKPPAPPSPLWVWCSGSTTSSPLGILKDNWHTEPWRIRLPGWK